LFHKDLHDLLIHVPQNVTIDLGNIPLAISFHIASYINHSRAKGT
jgi:hypothetical protein